MVAAGGRRIPTEATADVDVKNVLGFGWRGTLDKLTRYWMVLVPPLAHPARWAPAAPPGWGLFF